MEDGADVAGIAVTSPSLRTRGPCLPQSRSRPTPRLRFPPATVGALGGDGRVGAAMFTTRPQCADLLHGLHEAHLGERVGRARATRARPPRPGSRGGRGRWGWRGALFSECVSEIKYKARRINIERTIKARCRPHRPEHWHPPLLRSTPTKCRM